MQQKTLSSPPSSQPTIEIPLGYGLKAILDYDDFMLLHKYHWSARKSHSCWYAIRKETVHGLRRTVFLHRQIAAAPDDHQVHHANGNTLDNRRANLTVTTPREHAFLHAQLRLFKSNPDAHAACTAFLAAHGVTTLTPCGPFHP